MPGAFGFCLLKNDLSDFTDVCILYIVLSGLRCATSASIRDEDDAKFQSVKMYQVSFLFGFMILPGCLRSWLGGSAGVMFNLKLHKSDDNHVFRS